MKLIVGILMDRNAEISATSRAFVKAEWRNVAILNYPADRDRLEPLLPAGVELDLWDDRPFLSIVGLLFEWIELLGIRLPFYRSFEQVNVRFYVGRQVAGSWRRGVVFVKELVPYRTMAAAARLLYSQNYQFARMRHRFNLDTSARGAFSSGFSLVDPTDSTTGSSAQSSGCASDEQTRETEVEYCWRHSARWNRLAVKTTGPWETPAPGSFEEYITRRHWGYASLGRRRSVEFEVRRPSWQVRPAGGWLDWDVRGLSAKALADMLSQEPQSALLATGSVVSVSHRTRLRI